MNKCENCDNYEEINSEKGRCLVAPMLSSSGNENAVFPVVKGKIDRCSKYFKEKVKQSNDK